MSGLEVIAAIVLFIWASALSIIFVWTAKRHHDLITVAMIHWQITHELLLAIVNRLDANKKGDYKNAH